MRQTFLLLTILCSLLFANADSNINIVIETDPNNTDWTEGTIPEVKYDEDGNTIDIAFKSDDNYVATVTDENGNTECLFMVNTNGAKNSYHLPMLVTGTYTITLESGRCTFVGVFDVEK